jgi:hypothetical protein
LFNGIFFVFSKSEKGSSVVRDDSFTNMINQTSTLMNNKRLASAPPENANQISQRRSRLDATTNNSHEHIPSSSDENATSDFLSNSVISPTTSTKNRFFSLSRRFRFRTQSPEKSPTIPATVHFLDEDIDLETKEPTGKKSDKPSRGILKTLRHRSPFRFRSKDAVIVEQDPSPPPPPPPTPSAHPPASKEKKSKPLPPSSTKQRGRLIELKKTPTKTSSNGTPKKIVNVTPITDPPNTASLVRRASVLKYLIHKFEATPPKPKRVSLDNLSPTETNEEEFHDAQHGNKSIIIDFPDLLQNVEKDPAIPTSSRPMLRHSNSNRLTASFDSAVSMVSASESITTSGSNTRKPTSTARPLMLSVVSSINYFIFFSSLDFPLILEQGRIVIISNCSIVVKIFTYCFLSFSTKFVIFCLFFFKIVLQQFCMRKKNKKNQSLLINKEFIHFYIHQIDISLKKFIIISPQVRIP